MRKQFLLWTLFSTVFFVNHSFTQTGVPDSAAARKKNYWQAEINYLSNAVYLGRKDSMRLPYLSPTVGYYHRSGLYADGGFSYLAAQGENRIDLYYLDAGYTYSRKNFQAQLSATKYFYNKQSTNVNADVKAGLNFFSAYDIGWIQPSVEATINFSNVTDYILTLGLEHTFYAGDVDITPAVYMNAGTQNAYNSYYNKRKFTIRKRKLRVRNNADITASVADAASFKRLDYEFSMPVNYTRHRFTFNFTPNLALPVNPAVITYTVKSATGTQSSTLYRETLGNSFFWNAGVSLTL